MAIFSWLWRLLDTVDNLVALAIEWALKRIFGKDLFKAHQGQGHQGKGSGVMIVFAVVVAIAAVVIPMLFV